MDDLDIAEIPQRLTQRYLDTLSEEKRKAVIAYKQEQSRLLQIEHAKQYQKRNKKKINAYQRARRRKLKEQHILEEAKKIRDRMELENDNEE